MAHLTLGLLATLGLTSIRAELIAPVCKAAVKCISRRHKKRPHPTSLFHWPIAFAALRIPHLKPEIAV
ncbi:hypothetical protein M2418_002407 [Rhizobium sp. BIGb0125]|nr:hypothetical protein [Rhizobium sp. BIGb0125]